MNIVLSAMLALMLMGSIVGAQSMPTIIDGFIENEGPTDGFEVTIECVQTGDTQTVTSEKHGYFQFPMNINWRGGDDFIVTCEGKSVEVNDVYPGDVRNIGFDFTGEGVCPSCPECPVCEVCDECPKDTTPYAECDSCCETCPEDTTPYNEEDCVNFICTDCEDDMNIIWATLFSIIAAAGGATVMFKFGNNKVFTGVRTGMKIYRGRDGNLKIYHKHPGTKGYHNPEITHRKPENHPKGMIDVAKHYQKIDSEWRYL